MAIVDGYLILLNSYTHDSKILLFDLPVQGKRDLIQVITRHDVKTNSGLNHPYGIAVHPKTGHFYVSNQNTNTVTMYNGLRSGKIGVPLEISQGICITVFHTYKIAVIASSVPKEKHHHGAFVHRDNHPSTVGINDKGIRGVAFDEKGEKFFVAHKHENC